MLEPWNNCSFINWLGDPGRFQGLLEDCETEHLSLFNLDIPLYVEGVDKRYLNPRKNWPNQAQYDSQAIALAKLFIENIAKFSPSQDILDAGPRIIHS